VSQLRLPEGARGPFVVSIGDPAKLRKFLELNAAFVSPDQVFVDGYDRQLYADAGFGTISDAANDRDRAKDAARRLRAPDLGGFGRWFRYLANAAQLTPVPPSPRPSGNGGGGGGALFGIPSGVLQLGGTLVVRGDRVLFRHEDAVPGDVPDLNEVVRVLEGAVGSTPEPAPLSSETVA
jgi:hypothetical protein